MNYLQLWHIGKINICLGKKDGEIFEIYKLNSNKKVKMFKKKFIIFKIASSKNFMAID